MRIDQVMIKEMLGDRQLGLFSAATRLSEVWYFLPVIVTGSVFPAIVSAKKVSRSLYMQRLLRISTLMTWLAVAIALPVSFFASPIINLIYGFSFQEASLVLAIHIWSAVFVFLGVASGVFFTVENYTKKALYRTAIGAISNILLNMILIPHYGIVGAAFSTLIAQFSANLLYDFFDPTIRPLLKVKLKALFPICHFESLKDS
jgi:O-antigen/teichoic acid export membrane protein